MIGEIFIVLTIFAAITLIFWIFITNRNKERMALIENGADASLFTTKRNNNKLSTLKWGMLLLGIGVGILAGNILANYTSLEEPVPYFSMILLFGGSSLISYYLLERKINKQK